MTEREQIEAIVRRYSHRYERPHAVVEAERAMLAELSALGVAVAGPERISGTPYRKRYRVGDWTVEGVVHIPDTIIKLRVVDEPQLGDLAAGEG